MSESRPVGRPRIHDPEVIAPIFSAYIEDTAIPIVAEFAAQQGYGKHVLYDMANDSADFANLLRKCVTKKEAALERMGLKGEVNTPMAIFSLKQLGWSDKQENTLKGDKESPLVVITPSEAKF